MDEKEKEKIERRGGNVHKLKPLKPQAKRVIDRFGGPRRLARILKAIGRPKDPACIYRWTYPKERGGTGGIIPTSAWNDVLFAARVEGILLTVEDLFPNAKAYNK